MATRCRKQHESLGLETSLFGYTGIIVLGIHVLMKSWRRLTPSVLSGLRSKFGNDESCSWWLHGQPLEVAGQHGFVF